MSNDPQVHVSRYEDVVKDGTTQRADDRHGEVIAVANTKGGTGKTTLTFNLAHALGGAGLRTLVIDLDLQSGQSAFLRSAPPDADHDAGAVIMGRCRLADAVVRSGYRNLDVLPAEEWSMAVTGRRLLAAGSQSWLGELFTATRRAWDVVLVDTPGHQATVLSAALSACDGVIIPMPPEAGPVDELPTILNVIAGRRARSGRPSIHGIVRTRVWGNSIYRRVAEDQIRAIAAEHGVRLFRHKVPEDARFGEAHLVGLPVAEHTPRARSAVAYRCLAGELIDLRQWEAVGVDGLA